MRRNVDNDPVRWWMWQFIAGLAFAVLLLRACCAFAGRSHPQIERDEPWVYCGHVNNVDVSVWQGDFGCQQAQAAVSQAIPGGRHHRVWSRRWSVGLTKTAAKFWFDENTATYIGPAISLYEYLHRGYIHDLERDLTTTLPGD
jgi:hypothetical protein